MLYYIYFSLISHILYDQGLNCCADLFSHLSHFIYHWPCVNIRMIKQNWLVRTFTLFIVAHDFSDLPDLLFRSTISFIRNPKHIPIMGRQHNIYWACSWILVSFYNYVTTLSITHRLNYQLHTDHSKPRWESIPIPNKPKIVTTYCWV